MSVIFESGYSGGLYGPNNPRIGWNSIGKRGNVLASSEAVGYAAVNAIDPMTYNYWRPTSSSANYRISVPTAETINYCGIAAHNLGGTGSTVHFQTLNVSTWVTKGSHTPTDNGAIMFLCDDVTTTSARIVITGSLAPTIGVIAFGETIEIPRRSYAGYTPIDLAATVVFETNIGQGGQFEGRSVRRTGAQTDFETQYVTEEWYRANMLDFAEEARTRPFFIAERPEGYPDAVDYAFTEREIRFQRTGPKNYGAFVL